MSIAHDLRPRSILLFAGRFLLAFGLLLVAFPRVAPLYQAALHALANPILQRLAIRSTIEPLPGHGWRYVDTNARGQRLETVAFDASAAKLQSLNLILLPGLMLAMPWGWRRRGILLGYGLLLLFGVQFVTTLAWAPLGRCVLRDPGPLCGALFYTLITGGQLLAVAIWALLSLREVTRG